MSRPIVLAVGTSEFGQTNFALTLIALCPYQHIAKFAYSPNPRTKAAVAHIMLTFLFVFCLILGKDRC